MNRIEVREQIGKGGMAIVHRALEHGADGFCRTIAIKRLPEHVHGDSEVLERFIREAEIGRLLDHPNIATTYELGHDGARYYIAMECVEGWTLRQLLRRRRAMGTEMPLVVTLSVLHQAARALEHIHNRTDLANNWLGLAHRDVSASNLMITWDGEVKLIDFGLAGSCLDDDPRVVGKIDYMAPEEIAGSPGDYRSDIWSFGVLAWELVTGQRLFLGSDQVQTARNIVDLEIREPSAFAPFCPPELDVIIGGALERSRRFRSQCAGKIAVALEELAARLGLDISPSSVRTWLGERCVSSTSMSLSADTQPAPVAIGVRVRPAQPPSRAALAVMALFVSFASFLIARDGFGPAESAVTPKPREVVAASAPPVTEAKNEPSAEPPVFAPTERRRAKKRVRLPKRSGSTPVSSLEPEPALAPAPTPAPTAEPLFGTSLDLSRTAKPAPPRRVRVPASRVRKRSGKLPKLRLRRADRERTVRASADICIGTGGQVVSVRIGGNGSTSINKQLSKAIRSWSYHPYRTGGQAVRACFAKSFRIKQ